jgi:hypothetical protein
VSITQRALRQVNHGHKGATFALSTAVDSCHAGGSGGLWWCQGRFS